MPRKKRRALERLELLANEEGQDGEGGRKAIVLPNQKAVARKAKAEERRRGPVLGKRQRQEAAAAAPGAKPSPKKPKKPAANGASSSAVPKRPAGGSARSDSAPLPRKARSHSKAKFSKPRKR